MAGMNLHATGTEPRTLHLNLCEHGINMERSCIACRRVMPQLDFQDDIPQQTGPQAGDFYGDNRSVFEFVQEHGVEAVMCSACGGHNYTRVITEEWRKEETVDFSDLDEENPEHYGSISSAEFYDDISEDDWACNSCMHVASRELSNLMSDLNKEPY